jgi:thymidylate synthase (FAD)
MSDRIAILDHGYVSLVESWGSDERVIEAARMSTDGAFRGWGPKWARKRCGHTSDSSAQTCPECGDDDGTMMPVPGDEKLLAYLYRNNHSTPFEMAGLIVEVQAPIFVFREWHRHRTQSYNELSARYTPLPALDYLPTVERLMVNASGTNKQAGTVVGSAELTVEGAENFRRTVAGCYEAQERIYQAALGMGVPKELARIHLPVGRYSRMRASTNLRNWLAFLTLRQAPQAQWEIRQYADAVGALIEERFPRTWALYVEGRS